MISPGIVRKVLALALGTGALAGLAFLPLPVQSQEKAEKKTEPPQFAPEPVRVLDPDTIAVRLLLGVKDEQVRPWSGKVSVDKGEVVGVDPWRFREGDVITGGDSWESKSLQIRNPEGLGKLFGKTSKAVIGATAKKGAPAKKAASAKKGGRASDAESAILAAFNTRLVTPSGVIVRIKAPFDARLTLETKNGRTEINLADLESGAARSYLEGQVEARRVPTYAPLATGNDQEDYPAAAADGKGGAWVAFVTHLPRGAETAEAIRKRPESFKTFIPEGGGDRIELVHYEPAGTRPGERIDLTGPGHDLWRPALVRDGLGKLVVVWSEQKDGNWDLYTRSFDPEKNTSSEVKRLTTDPGTDTDPVLAFFNDRVFVAWQAWRDGQADIFLAPIDRIDAPLNISRHPADDWSPAIAAGPNGVEIAFDSYRNGNYDVFLARLPSNGTGEPALIAVADSGKFEARPTLAVASDGRTWVAFEERAENWGKDFGKIPDPKGAGLYSVSAVRVRVVEGNTVHETADPVANLSVPEKTLNSYARLALDGNGRPWLTYRHRQEFSVFGGAVLTAGAVWVGYATSLSGQAWAPPQLLPRSDGLLDNRPALVARPDGGILVVYSSDGRLHRELPLTRELALSYFSHQGTPPGLINDDVFIAALRAPQGSPAPQPLGPLADAGRESSAPAAHPNEAEDVARIRGYRVKTAGKTYQLLRGEFHRHTEHSFDGVGDGSLEDMWRYALDAGQLDWLGTGDHDNGGREYSWWISQKTTDLYHAAPRFFPLFTYERSVQYPGGHRNVMFPYRGVRTLPRLVDEKGVRSDIQGRDEDAETLYAYLHELGGICASHTTATSMGTDWRANDPEVEPFVEIYQGVRDSYEHLGAPRVPRYPEAAAGGWAPLGQVWNALALQYRLGFEASSDHVSTHISFAVALTEDPSRKGIFEAFKKRHCYAATDNIILDVRSGEHLLGDEFKADGPVTLKVFAHGTAPIKRVDIIKNFTYVYSTEPKSEKVDFQWTDEETAPAGDLSWYYVRLIQENGELAWGSPLWVHRSSDSAER